VFQIQTSAVGLLKRVRETKMYWSWPLLRRMRLMQETCSNNIMRRRIEFTIIFLLLGLFINGLKWVAISRVNSALFYEVATCKEFAFAKGNFPLSAAKSICLVLHSTPRTLARPAPCWDCRKNNTRACTLTTSSEVAARCIETCCSFIYTYFCKAGNAAHKFYSSTHK
jgi:hypothetical protein